MKVLVPLDGSPLAEAAVRVARRQVETCGGEIILLTVGEVAETSEHRHEEHAALRRIVDPVAERLTGLNVQVRTSMGGDAVAAILRTVEEEGIDQIVMSTHGRSGLSLLTHGSVADGVLRNSPVPVTLVRPGAADVEAQRALLEDTDCAEFVAAATAALKGGAELSSAHLERLRACLDELPERDQLPAAEAYLGALPEAERRAAVVEFVRSANPARREAALHAASELGQEAIPALAAVATATGGESRWAAYHAIQKIGGEAAVAPLIEALHSDELAVRWIGSDGLTAIGRPAARELLHSLAVSTPNFTFHRAALRVVRRLDLPGHEAALQRLTASLERSTSVVQAPPLAHELLREIEQDPRL